MAGTAVLPRHAGSSLSPIGLFAGHSRRCKQLILWGVRCAGDPHPLASIADDIASDGEAWRAYYELDAPETAALPGGYSGRLSQFEVLLLLRCLRVDRVVVGITHFVIQTLGDRYVTPPVLDYHAIFRQSSPTTPVVFVLSPGADPAFDVFRC